MSRDEMTILTWHSIDPGGSVVSVRPEQFADQMSAIADAGYNGISLRQALIHREREGEWPAKSVVLTFDDGYENFYSDALPEIARHGFSATVFLISRHIDGFNDWATPPDGLGRQRMLSWAQVREAAAAGIEIGAHTRTHPDLRRLSEAEARHEIIESRIEIEDRAGCEARTFAYPFGYRSRTADRIVAGEFSAACTTDLRRASTRTWHALPRIDVYYLRRIDRFVRALDGRLDNYLALRRWGRHVRTMLDRN
ncbi:MAG: polysaccharide deacetylase family protein [Acidobacteriota bacterium]|nr:MAG: polysaccharide deacetylase family protein [Acidobacteriota bacterium]